jgi:hypothetical protein
VKCHEPSGRQLGETPSDPPSPGTTYGVTSENFGGQTWSRETHKNADGGRGREEREEEVLFCVRAVKTHSTGK